MMNFLNKHRMLVGIFFVIVMLGLALSLPTWVDNLWMRTLTDFFKIAALASAWNLIGGFTGYPSFGNVAFFGLGAYGAGIAMAQFHWPFALALVASVLVALLYSLFLGLPALRLKGHYFAIATLGSAEAIKEIIRNLDIAGANTGLILPLESNASIFYFLFLALLCAALLITYVLSRTHFGYALLAIREDEEAAGVCGIHTTNCKLAAFALSAAISGLIGGIHAYQLSYIDPEGMFDVKWTVQMIVMSVIGGAGTVSGPLIGAFLVFFSAEYLARLSTNAPALALIVYGSIILGGALLLPKGLMDIVSGRTPLRWAYFVENLRRHKV